MKEIRKLSSQNLIGITKDHDNHRDGAPMHSTGVLIQFKDGEADPRSWYVEYKCSVCNELVYQGDPDLFDVIRKVLKENDTIKDA